MQKWVDSLVGYDNNSNQLPDIDLSVPRRYGILNTPNQSMFVNKTEALKQIDEIVASCKKRLGKPKTYTGNFVPPQQQQQVQSGSPNQQPAIASPMQAMSAPSVPSNQNFSSSWTPTSNVPSMTGAPKPTFSLDAPSPKKKPKNKKGFQSEIKNLLKSDKDNSITIEKKTI